MQSVFCYGGVTWPHSWSSESHQCIRRYLPILTTSCFRTWNKNEQESFYVIHLLTNLSDIGPMLVALFHLQNVKDIYLSFFPLNLVVFLLHLQSVKDIYLRFAFLYTVVSFLHLKSVKKYLSKFSFSKSGVDTSSYSKYIKDIVWVFLFYTISTEVCIL